MKFNTTKTIKTTNKSGHVAYGMDDKSKLVTQVLTSFFNEKKFYGDNSKDMVETIKRVVASDPEFIAKLAVFARREFNMRSVAHVLVAYLAHEPSGKPFARRAMRSIALRGDDLTETVAFYLATFGKPLPHSLRNGISDKLQTMDEYQLAKYKGAGKSVAMKDLLCLCRPKPVNDAQSELWQRVLNNELAVPMTWETQLSADGNNAETWQRLIDSGKVGYMALLRNLRNIIKADPSNISKVYETIADPNRVRKSKQLPFRFLSAYKSIQEVGSSAAFSALEAAVDASVDNLPKLHGRTVIAIDVSGSMSQPVSAKSDVTCVEISTMLGLLANRICDDAIVYKFNTDIRRGAYPLNVAVLATASEAVCGGGTDMYLPFKAMLDNNIKADRVIIISDNECNSPWRSTRTVQSLADKYRKKSGNDIWIHAIDLQGYGTQQFHGDKTNIIAGWSDKVFEFILLAEQGEGALLDAIEAYDIQG